MSFAARSCRTRQGKTIWLLVTAGAATTITAMVLFVVIILPAIGVAFFMRWFLDITSGLAAP